MISAEGASTTASFPTLATHESQLYSTQLIRHLRALACAFASAIWARSERAFSKGPDQHRAATRPEQASSTQAGFVSVDLRETQPTACLVLASKPDARNGRRPHARTGRSRATRRSRERSEWDVGELCSPEGGMRRAGRAGENHQLNSEHQISTIPSGWD